MSVYCEIQWEESLSPSWQEVRNGFLRSLFPSQRRQVSELLRDGDVRGRGLRTWLRLIAAQGGDLQSQYPEELVQVYLDDDEAMPLHDCAGCGVAIPVRPAWQGAEGGLQEIYFPKCPCCGARTGLYAAWSRANGSTEVAVAVK